MMAALREAIRRLFPPLKVRSKLWGSMVVLTIYGLLVSVAISIEHLPHIDWGAESAVLNGVVLSFLIAFRNNHAYDRWWEARKLWGQLVNENRNLCLKVRSLVGVEAADREAIGRLVIAFAEALKDHLRRRDGSDEPRPEDETKGGRVHEPICVAGAILDTVLRWQGEGRIDGWGLLWLDGQVKSLMDICGACERIRNTPLSSSYRALLRHGLALYLALAPFYLIEDTGLAGFPMFELAAYFLMGIELVAEEIEEPFGAGGDNLPLERYCATIATSVHEILGAPGESAPPDLPSGS
jgi:ion channel-forming bestrophin family protein